MSVASNDYTLTYPDGRTEIPFSQPNYNLNWQIYYDFAKPIKIPKGTKIHVDAWFDNSANNLSFAKTRPVRNPWFPVIVKTSGLSLFCAFFSLRRLRGLLCLHLRL